MTELQHLLEADKEWSTRIFTFTQEKNLRRYVRLWASTCDGWFWYSVPGIMAIYLKNKPYASMLWDLWMGTILTALAVTVIKVGVKRERPPINPKDRWFIGPDIHSFPSGHASRAFYLGTFSLFVNPYWGILVFLWSIGVGIARIALGRHYPSDVFGGLLLGSAVGVLVQYCNLLDRIGLTMGIVEKLF